MVKCILFIDIFRTGKTTLGSVSQKVFGKKAKPTVCVLLIIMLFFAHIGYMVLLSDLLSPLFRELFPNVPPFFTSRGFCVFVCLLFVYPFSSCKTLSALQYSAGFEY